MRPLRLALWWAAAAWVAFTVVIRIARGEVVILSSYAAPVVRLVALIVVFLVGCAEKLKPGDPNGQHGEPGQSGSQGSQGGAPAVDPAKPEEPAAVETPAPTIEPADPVAQEFPANLSDETLRVMYGWIEPRGLWRRMSPGGTLELGDEVTFGVKPLGAMKEFKAQVEAFNRRQQAGEAETATTLTALLAAAEAVPLYDAWLAGFVWLRARGLRPAPVALLARVERHMRVTHALVLAQASTGPVEFTAWRSKAAPPVGWRGAMRVPAGLAAAAKKAFDDGADAGQFETAAALSLTVAQGSPVLVRRAVETPLAVGKAVRLRRLDVLRAPAGATLRHATLGPLTLPAGAEVTAWSVGEYLGPEARAQVRGWIDAALGGDAAALNSLEAVLPAAHAAIREAERARPDAPGAANLRTLLTAFDE